MNFHLKKQKNPTYWGQVNMKGAALAQSRVSPKTADEKVSRTDTDSSFIWQRYNKSYDNLYKIRIGNHSSAYKSPFKL